MSTTHAILDVLTASYDQINDNNFTWIIDYLISKQLLKLKLEQYGIRGVAHKLMSYFFIWKTTYLAYQDMQSEIVTNRFEVPKGSNLRPLLFLIYTGCS